MTVLLEKAMQAVSRLSAEQQDAIAREILDRLQADARWNDLLTDPRSPALLKRLADEARADIAKGEALDTDPAQR
jgi:hypothetical protein